MSHKNRQKTPAALPPIHELTIPDELLMWGRQPENARRWVKPYAHEIDQLVKRSQRRPLEHHETETLLARLEALCVEAITADRDDLILGIDIFTAEWIGLSFSFDIGDKRITIGESLSYAELRLLHEMGSTPESTMVALELKDQVAEAFPGAQIDAIIDLTRESLVACYGCGSAASSVMISLDTGSDYCGECWSTMTKKREPKPKPEKRKRTRTT